MNFLSSLFKNFFKDKLGLRLQQFIILILHLILVKWMIYTLSELGMERTEVVLTHYVGMAIYSGLLIRGCAAWGKYRYRLDLEKEQGPKSEN